MTWFASTMALAVRKNWSSRHPAAKRSVFCQVQILFISKRTTLTKYTYVGSKWSSKPFPSRRLKVLNIGFENLSFFLSRPAKTTISQSQLWTILHYQPKLWSETKLRNAFQAFYLNGLILAGNLEFIMNKTVRLKIHTFQQQRRIHRQFSGLSYWGSWNSQLQFLKSLNKGPPL